jgi:hypothetical protein
MPKNTAKEQAISQIVFFLRCIRRYNRCSALIRITGYPFEGQDERFGPCMNPFMNIMQRMTQSGEKYNR